MERQARSARCKASGFGLIEILIVLSLLALLVGIGVPDLSRLGEAQRASAVLDELRASLEMARQEAVRRGTLVVLCRRLAGAQECADYRSQGQLSWAEGWLVFEDRDLDRRFEPADGEQILRVGNALDSGYRLKWNMGDYVAFAPTGALASRSGSFCLDHAGGSELARTELKIPYTGRVRVTRNQCSFTL